MSTTTAPARRRRKIPATSEALRTGLRAIVGARISNYTEESVSTERQLKDGKQYAKGEGWPVVGAFKDEDVSATEVHPLDRPELRPWLTERVDEWDVLIFWKLDRIVRSPMDLWEMIQWCDDHGKYLVFVADKFDLTTEMGRAMATIAAVFARMEVANTSQRLREAFKTLRPTKRWTGKVPYGFTLVDAPDGKGKVLAPVPEALANVREAGLRFMDDAVPESGQAIAEGFNKRGVLSPADFARKLAGKKVRGEKWIGDSVRRLFQNPIYLGLKTYQGKPIIGDDGMPVQVVEPTFSDAEWKRLEARLQATAIGERNRTAGVATPYLGSLVCKCGEPWYRCRQVRKDGREDVDRYYCRNKAHLRGQITGLPKPSSVKTEVLNEWFENFIMQAYGSIPKTRREFVPGEDHTAELERVETAIARLRNDRENGDYDGEEAEYRRRLAALRDNRKRLSALPQRPDRWEIVETGETWEEWWAGAGEEERRNELVRAGVKVYWFKPQGSPDMEMGLHSDARIGERLMDPTASAPQGEPFSPFEAKRAS